jgi:hypothetical protein
MIAGAAAWRKLAERIAARPEGLQTLIRVVAAARIGPPLPVKPADLQLALDTWNEHDLVHRLLRANDSQPRLCGRTLLAIESRGLHRPRFGTFEAWRAETGWSGPEMDEGLAWARAHPDVRAELPYSEADCCKQAWTMLSLELDEPRDEQERDGDRPTDGEKRAFNTSLNACMKVAAAAGWPWPKGIGLFVRAAEELGPA